jgi:hypothetical protein
LQFNVTLARGLPVDGVFSCVLADTTEGDFNYTVLALGGPAAGACRGCWGDQSNGIMAPTLLPVCNYAAAGRLPDDWCPALGGPGLNQVPPIPSAHCAAPECLAYQE